MHLPEIQQILRCEAAARRTQLSSALRKEALARERNPREAEFYSAARQLIADAVGPLPATRCKALSQLVAGIRAQEGRCIEPLYLNSLHLVVLACACFECEEEEYAALALECFVLVLRKQYWTDRGQRQRDVKAFGPLFEFIYPKLQAAPPRLLLFEAAALLLDGTVTPSSEHLLKSKDAVFAALSVPGHVPTHCLKLLQALAEQEEVCKLVVDNDSYLSAVTCATREGSFQDRLLGYSVLGKCSGWSLPVIVPLEQLQSQYSRCNPEMNRVLVWLLSNLAASPEQSRLIMKHGRLIRRLVSGFRYEDLAVKEELLFLFKNLIQNQGPSFMPLFSQCEVGLALAEDLVEKEQRKGYLKNVLLLCGQTIEDAEFGCNVRAQLERGGSKLKLEALAHQQGVIGQLSSMLLQLMQCIS